MPTRVRKLTEILVFRQQDSAFAMSECQDHVVCGSRCVLHDRLDVMARSAERNDHSEVAALISIKSAQPRLEVRWSPEQ